MCLDLTAASNSHYNHNAQTYMDAGLAMGDAMMKLLKGKRFILSYAGKA